ncbi:hypothetical protein CAPTEDRAFT_224167 [Capitella teleta]|uniref:BUB1 N-terminal domain-containing protein n=1 Tax=Capitella teleta TaxID=283909 RepID=R7T5N9_CAPTE|nr:hypothetical protein CAPTEDRAFT_224167 [Capitella teleta]|eukprot:ELT88694.1 hypothetical protein CAPTEDRAFT_224167 [Capitella teleta]
MASFEGRESDASDWELSKENVQPLRQGRNVQQLLLSQSEDETAKRQIKEQQHEFEAKLRIYSGDDPLDTWDRYIKWTEQNFPKGGQENSIAKILERCALQFKDTERYANDPRYLSVWLRFIRFCPNGFEIFNFLFSNGIGVELAAFYEAWAALFESIGNTKKADFIFNQGIQKGAHPVSSLQTKHREFQARTARASVSAEKEQVSGGFIPDSREEQRTTLGDLRGVGKRQQAPHLRVGDAKLTQRGGLSSSAKPLEQANSLQPFTIHADDEGSAPVLPTPGAKDWGTAPSGREFHKENDRSAAQWTKAKLKVRKHAPHLAMSEVSKMTTPSFQVYEDEEEPKISATPRKLTAVDSVLSARKADKPSDLFLSIQSSQQKPAASSRAPPPVQREVPMYCKYKIDSGAEEFSFEEIRAERYNERKRKQAEEEEKARQAAEKQKAFLAECQRKMQLQMEQQQSQMFQQIQQLQNQLHELKTSAPSPGHSMEGATPVDQIGIKAMASSSGTTPDPSLSLPSSGEKANFNSTSSASSSLLSGPSPTVNTKMAFNQVRGWFGTTLNTSIESEFAAQLESVVEPITALEPKPEPAKPAFTVFEDDKENGSVPVKPPSRTKPVFGTVLAKPLEQIDEVPAAAPFPVYQDEENAECSAPSVKRQALRALLPRPPPEEEAETKAAVPNFAPPDEFDALDLDDMTFAPKFSSTCNFTAMPQMTPFSHGVSQAKETPAAASTVFMDSTAPQPPPAEEPASVRPKNNRRMSQMMLDNGHKLSPIDERSEESSLGSSNGHSTMAATTLGLTTLHATNVSVAPVAVATDLNRTTHEINVTGYVAPDEHLAQEQLNASIAIDIHDPFDKKLIERFLSRLHSPIELHPNFHSMSSPMPHFAPHKTVNLGGTKYLLTKQVGQGGYATVYACEPCIENEDDSMDLDSKEIVIKRCVPQVQKPACVWEFYISTEIIKRSAKLPPPLNMQGVTMTIDDGYFFTDGSCLLNQRHEYGTILDLVNACAKHSLQLPWEFLAYLATEILLMLEMFSRCEIIHGDLKPDNFLITCFPRLNPDQKLHNLLEGKQKMLKLIDFGCSIDMRQFPSGTTFSASVDTSGFQCIEMKTNRPWTYQTDLFGAVGTLHVLIFGKYMDVIFNSATKTWKQSGVFKRFWPGVETWKSLFADFMNVPSCDQLPDLTKYRSRLEEIVRSCNLSSVQFNALMERLEKALIRI